MSILIKGLNLPKEELNQERLTITIWANGCVTNDGDWIRNEDGTYRKEYWNYEQFSAVELPPHGRLIDIDRLLLEVNNLINSEKGILQIVSETEKLIRNAPIVLESEET